MVRGLDVFREHFAGHADQFVLIGGTAATLAMEEAGLEFRATKDLDIVLHIEALSPSFGEVFWRFIEAGRYEIRQASDTGRRRQEGPGQGQHRVRGADGLPVWIREPLRRRPPRRES